jgi:hypothetical protein
MMPIYVYQRGRAIIIQVGEGYRVEYSESWPYLQKSWRIIRKSFHLEIM